MIAGFNGFDVWRYTSPTITTVVSPLPMRWAAKPESCSFNG